MLEILHIKSGTCWVLGGLGQLLEPLGFKIAMARFAASLVPLSWATLGTSGGRLGQLLEISATSTCSDP